MTAPKPHTTAYRAFECNLEGIVHLQKLSLHEMVMARSQAERLTTGIKQGLDLTKKSTQAKLVRSLNRDLLAAVANDEQTLAIAGLILGFRVFTYFNREPFIWRIHARRRRPVRRLRWCGKSDRPLKHGG